MKNICPYIIAIIPARGGSQRIPNKNIIPVAGHPLIAHSIMHAKASQKISEVIVSTDSDQVARISKKYGATVIHRPKKLSTHKATSESAILHVLNERTRKKLKEPDLVVFLQCTSPIRAQQDIDNAIQQLLSQKADSLFSACENTRFIWEIKNNQAVSISYDYKNRKREQDLTKQYRENGSIYVFYPSIIRKYNNRLGGKISIYEMDYWSSFQIDTPEHFELIKWVMQQSGHNNKLSLPKKIELVVFDFDGVMTNNTVRVFKNGTESVICHRGDGLGIARLKRKNIPMMVLSTEKNSVVQKRCNKLNIPCFHGLENKLAFLKKTLKKSNIKAENVIYLGNDVNDNDCLKYVGFPVVVSDAHPDTIKYAKWILSKKGGNGAVRELCDLIEKYISSSK